MAANIIIIMVTINEGDDLTSLEACNYQNLLRGYKCHKITYQFLTNWQSLSFLFSIITLQNFTIRAKSADLVLGLNIISNSFHTSFGPLIRQFIYIYNLFTRSELESFIKRSWSSERCLLIIKLLNKL